MPTDITNTTTWQAEGNSVFRLRETGCHFRGQPITENEYYITVQTRRREDSSGEEKLAQRIAAALNEEPTSQDMDEAKTIVDLLVMASRSRKKRMELAEETSLDVKAHADAVDTEQQAICTLLDFGDSILASIEGK